MSRPHIVIVGGGFGGMYTARSLKHYVKQGLLDITIINKTNYFLFTPLLHEVATGSLTPTSVSESLHEIYKNTNIRIYQDSVTEINTDEKTVSMGDKKISYDYLVVASGAETNYYNTPGAQENTLAIKNLTDAVKLRNQVLDMLENASHTEDEQKRNEMLSFVVVGGGASGIETVTELEEFISDTSKKYYKNNPQCKNCISITLVSTSPHLVQMFNPKIQEITENRVRSKGIVLKLGQAVTAVESGKLTFSDGSTLSAQTIIWAAGVKPTTPPFTKTPELVGGRIKVDSYMRMHGSDTVFVLGDTAGVSEKEGDVLHPMLAQVALAQAKTVAHNIVATAQRKELKHFTYVSKGSLLSLGQWYAAGEIYSVIISGPIAWWIWRTTYLSKFMSWSKRIRIAFEWTINMFYPRDITRL